MGFIGQGNPKLICYLIHLEKTDPDIYIAIRRRAFEYAEANSHNPIMMNAAVDPGEILVIIEVIGKIIKILKDIFTSKEETREDKIAKELSKYTHLELFESVRSVDCMTNKEKAEYLLAHEV